MILQGNTNNEIISPVSVYTLLAILQQGARSYTRDEITRAIYAEPQEVLEAYTYLIDKYQVTRN